MAPPIGTPGCTGGGAGRTGALYTGRGPVCGTIIRGAGCGGVAGFVVTGAAGAALAETTGGAAAGGAEITGDVAERTGGAETGEDAADCVGSGGPAPGRVEITGAEGDALAEAGAASAAGFTTGGATVVGRLTAAGGAAAGFSAGGCATGACVTGCGRGATGGATASLCCVIAFSTSPGRDICDRSILVLISSSPRTGRELDLPVDEEPSAAERMYTRTFSASCSSSELECVFFSVTPTSGSVSRIALLLTSSSLARSLIRTLLIRPFVSPRCS